MPSDTIEDRMAAALDGLRVRHPKRGAKAFYLSPTDWDEFMAKDRPTGRFPWGNNPTKWRSEPTFRAVPVRQSTGKGLPGASRLYDTTASGRLI